MVVTRRGIKVPSSWKKQQLITRIHESMQAGDKVVDVDGSYLWRKYQSMCVKLVSTLHPSFTLSGWELVTETNYNEYADKIPQVTPGTLNAYLAESVGRAQSHGAFRALTRGFTHWSSGCMDHVEVNTCHSEYCHVRARMTPSMKPGLYHVYILLHRDGDLAAGKSASCIHVSALLHALVAMGQPVTPFLSPGMVGVSDEDDVLLINPSDNFDITQFITFSTSNTRLSSGHKLIYNSSFRTNTSRHFYFRRLVKLWNSFPPIDLSRSVSTIKHHLINHCWKTFLDHFNQNNICSYHTVCPCSTN